MGVGIIAKVDDAIAMVVGMETGPFEELAHGQQSATGRNDGDR